MELKEKLAMFRTRQGLSQNELASKINVSRQAIYKWERGTAVPSTENLVALSRLYGVPLDELVNGKSQHEEKPPVAEGTQAPPPAGGEAPGKRGRSIAARIGLAACLALVTIAAVITIVSAIAKKPEKTEDGYPIISQDDLVREDIDLSQVIDGTGGTVTIEP